MIRNVPTQCTLEELLEAWPLDGSWDFLYLPMRAGGKAFSARWQSGSVPGHNGGRRLKVSCASTQGLEANVQALRQKPASRMRCRQCRPIIVKEGRVVGLDDV